MKQIKIFSITILSIIFITFLVNFVFGYNNSTTQATGTIDMTNIVRLPHAKIKQTTEENRISYIVENDGEIGCYVRIIIFTSPYCDTYLSENSYMNGWLDDGMNYYYFENPLQVNESSNPIEIEIPDIPPDLNIVAIVESVPIFYSSERRGLC